MRGSFPSSVPHWRLEVSCELQILSQHPSRNLFSPDCETYDSPGGDRELEAAEGRGGIGSCLILTPPSIMYLDGYNFFVEEGLPPLRCDFSHRRSRFPSRCDL